MFEGGASPTEVGTLKQPELAASTSFKCIFNSFASTGRGDITTHGTPSRFHDLICKGKRVVYSAYVPVVTIIWCDITNSEHIDIG